MDIKIHVETKTELHCYTRSYRPSPLIPKPATGHDPEPATSSAHSHSQYCPPPAAGHGRFPAAHRIPHYLFLCSNHSPRCRYPPSPFHHPNNTWQTQCSEDCSVNQFGSTHGLQPLRTLLTLKAAERRSLSVRIAFASNVHCWPPLFTSFCYLTNNRAAFLEKLMVTDLTVNLNTFYGTRMFITAFTTGRACTTARDFRLPKWLRTALFWILTRVVVITDVSGQPVGPILRFQETKKKNS